MPIWKYTGKEVTEEDIRRALQALRKACFQCGIGVHSDDCPIMNLMIEIHDLLRDKAETP